MTQLMRILIVALLIQVSCHEKKIESDPDLNKANSLLSKYLITGDREYLVRSYDVIKSRKNSDRQVVTKSQFVLVSSILMYLRKYPELKVLVNQNGAFVRDKQLTLNLIEALQVWPQDSGKALRYIDSNIAQIDKQINDKPTDSLLYVDYFIMRLYRFGRPEVLAELDSFKTKDTIFSSVFHDQVLRDVIEEYPDDFLFPAK